jgi:thiamine-phosphate pyrophosphorylase
MNLRKEDLLLYAVTDRSWLKDNSLVKQVEEAVKGGVTLVQLREKEMPLKEQLVQAREIHELTKRYGIPLIINDEIEIALAVQAEGVHLGQEDMELHDARARLGADKIIGISAHTVEEAIKAQNNGADYIGVGAVFATSTKDDAKAVTRETLAAICDAVSIPVVAIGGISYDNILSLKGTGIAGVAVVSALFAQPEIGEAARKLALLAHQVVNERV